MYDLLFRIFQSLINNLHRQLQRDVRIQRGKDRFWKNKRVAVGGGKWGYFFPFENCKNTKLRNNTYDSFFGILLNSNSNSNIGDRWKIQISWIFVIFKLWFSIELWLSIFKTHDKLGEQNVFNIFTHVWAFTFEEKVSRRKIVFKIRPSGPFFTKLYQFKSSIILHYHCVQTDSTTVVH